MTGRRRSAVWHTAPTLGRMLELLRQRRWLGFTVFALAMVTLCLLLSRWQWHRYEQRTQENARMDAALSAPPVDIAQLLTPTPAQAAPSPLDPALVWRMVSATGTFDPAGEVAVRRRPLDGHNGFWIITPLVTDAGVVLVNRGWAPAGKDTATAPEVSSAPTGIVTVTGRLRAPEQTKTTDAPPAGQAWAADPQALLATQHLPRFDAYIELRTGTPASSAGLTVLTEDPGHRGWNNVVYSVQWVLFALVGLLGWWRLLRQEEQQRARRARIGAPASVTAIDAAEPDQ
jgi:cytochrome oxidase assembly protein ShyY1